MMAERDGASADHLPAAIRVTRERMEAERRPDLRLRDVCVLRDGPRVTKRATHWVIVDRNTGAVHHHALKIETITKTLSGRGTVSESRSITLDDDDQDSINALRTFIDAIRDPRIPEVSGDFYIIPVPREGGRLTSLTEAFAKVSTQAGGAALADAVAQLAGNPDAMEAFVESTGDDPRGSRFVTAAINLVLFRRAIRELRRLIEANANEHAFQRHLTAHPWMFGSEYSELLDQRRWTRDEMQDFILRRTADGYLEIVGIKTPLGGDNLFAHDPGRDVYAAKQPLSATLG